LGLTPLIPTVAQRQSTNLAQGWQNPKKTKDAIIIFKPEIKPIKPMFFYKTDGFFISKICDKS
jgi:hypothetical protein